MNKCIPPEPSFRNEERNTVSGQHKRNSDQKELPHVKLEPNKTHQNQIFFIQDRIEKGDIGLDYCHTDKMVANFMKNALQGKKFFKFRDCITGMPNGENIAEMRKVRDEIAQNEDLQNGQTSIQLE